MGINVFPPASGAAGGNFVVDMNDTTNNVATLDSPKGAGTYNISLDSGDTSFDIYLIDSSGNNVGYSNSASITASSAFEQVAVLGVVSSEIISFSFAGVVSNASSTGSAPGAGAYLESITPSDLPSIDDTATVAGGNFASDVEITFESGATVLQAKNIVVNSSTELLVTRPDGLVEDDSPYTLKAVNPGVTPPTGTDSHILTDAVTAGSDPTWVTTSPLDIAAPGVAFSQTLEASDAEGTVVDYQVTTGTITPGLSLEAATGIISGTPTTSGNFTFTVTATDDGGNSTAKQFEQAVQLASGGTIVDDGGFRYHTFTATDDFEVFAEITDAEILVVAGGGGGGNVTSSGSLNGGQGGGGAGGVLTSTSTLSAQTFTCTVGAGGGGNSQGSSSSFGSLVVTTGGGRGGSGNGGSGGGAGQQSTSGGSGIAGQGNDGGATNGANDNHGAGGGGKGANGGGAGTFGPGGGGIGTDTFSAFASATSTGAGGYYAGGGGGGSSGNPGGNGGAGGGGKGANGSSTNATSGSGNTGGGGGGGAASDNVFRGGASGGSGIVIVRYAI